VLSPQQQQEQQPVSRLEFWDLCLTSTNRKTESQKLWYELRGRQRPIKTKEAIELVKTYQEEARARARPFEIEPKVYIEIKIDRRCTGLMKVATSDDVIKNVGQKRSEKQRR
jgi:hypothetical protein